MAYIQGHQLGKLLSLPSGCPRCHVHTAGNSTKSMLSRSSSHTQFPGFCRYGVVKPCPCPHMWGPRWGRLEPDSGLRAAGGGCGCLGNEWPHVCRASAQENLSLGLQAKTGSSDTSPVAVLGSGVEPSQRLGFHVRDARRRWPWGGDTLCPVWAPAWQGSAHPRIHVPFAAATASLAPALLWQLQAGAGVPRSWGALVPSQCSLPGATGSGHHWPRPQHCVQAPRHEPSPKPLVPKTLPGTFLIRWGPVRTQKPQQSLNRKLTYIGINWM